MSPSAESTGPDDTFFVVVDQTTRRVSPVGDLDLSGVGTMIDAATSLQRTRRGDLTVDLAAVSFMDAAGLGALIRIQRSQAAAEARLVLANASGAVRRLFSVASLGHLLAV